MQMAMARSSSGLAYPERFYAAASYAGFDGSHNSTITVSSKFQNDTALLLYALYQQATIGPCNVPKPSSWKAVEQSKWKSWQGLGNMASTEAMRLFVKILEEDDPSWYSRASNSISESVTDTQVNHYSDEHVIENGNSFPDTKTISTENGTLVETQDKDDKDVVSEDVGTVAVYDQWITPPITGQPPKARYEHGAAIVQDKMYIYGGNHNGRYLNDLHVLDLRSWSWYKVNFKAENEPQEGHYQAKLTPCAGHSLIPWENKLLSIAGHTKDPSETIQVKVFDLQSCTWSTLKTYGKAPISRGGQSVTLVGTSLVIFGGQDAKRSLLNDLHILDLETMTWDEIDAIGVSPSPRSDHAAAVHAERYLLIFGGGSHATCFNDLHVLDLQTMEWTRPTQQGEIPTPRAGHAGVTVGENWFIVGGGDNKSGVSDTAVLNMSTLGWSVVTSVQGRAPLASEGLSLVLSSYNGEDILVSFGGYNGHYSNEVNVLKPSHKSTLESKIAETPVPDSVSAIHNITNPTRDVDSEFEGGHEGKIREIVMDNIDQGSMKSRGEGTSEHLLATLKAEREELNSSLSKEKLQTLHLKQELTDAETRNTDLYKELQSVRGQLAADQSRCFKLEVDVAELRQKLQNMEALQKELELLQRQKAASEHALNANHRQGSGGVWGWLAGTPGSGNQKEDDA
ncbi:PREDICTED: acyl-CoA-binding domain-containing protein 4 [Populus euphratica]|uniref:Acyl-CoA-binding domain-containing protein 4 n=1 Tax=Populus euphratica TaxID=75702 RepID=A0AAJ6UVB7_POPEU|nr:PREDICTED: acyl-CoA-binding domain-containing protein 4 [Populus euphratica]